jgi:hypothetical protein
MAIRAPSRYRLRHNKRGFLEMRAALLFPLCLAMAGCSSEPEKAPAPAIPGALAAGEWEVTTDVTRMESTDSGRPAIQAKVGDKSSDKFCLAAGDATKPPPALFVGDDDRCTYNNSYVRNGKINASLRCSREGLRGDIMKGLEGRFDGASFEATVGTTSFLVSDGDVRIESKVTGRRIGDCKADDAEKDKGKETK